MKVYIALWIDTELVFKSKYIGRSENSTMEHELLC